MTLCPPHIFWRRTDRVRWAGYEICWGRWSSYCSCSNHCDGFHRQDMALAVDESPACSKINQPVNLFTKSYSNLYTCDMYIHVYIITYNITVQHFIFLYRTVLMQHQCEYQKKKKFEWMGNVGDHDLTVIITSDSTRHINVMSTCNQYPWLQLTYFV